MFKKELFFKTNRTDRYVSANSTRRAYQYLGEALVCLGLFLSSFSLVVIAEPSPSNVIATLKETEVRKEPYPDAESLGILPAKSLVTLTGEEKLGFTEITVELEEGDLTGWIESSVIKEEAASESEDSEQKKVIPIRKRRTQKQKKVDVPVDEGVLLGRQPTFSYGALLGSHIDRLSIEEPEGIASGNGFTAGVSLSFVIDPSFRLRPELTYSSHAGFDSSDRLLTVSFIDIAALGEFPLSKDFFLLGGFQYSLGMGLDNLDKAINPDLIEEAADLSGIWGQLGVGYKFSVGEQSFLSLRANYRGAFMTSPVAFHVFGIQAVFEIEG